MFIQTNRSLTKVFEMIRKNFPAALLLSVILSAKAVSDPIVELSFGKLRGKQRENFYEFKSIPYAEPTVGEYRFESAKPFSSKWEGVRDAISESNICMQWDEFYPGFLQGSEDCLYLNVFTPSIDGENLYPVIIHIHGGAFMFGSIDIYDPLKIMRTGKFVVVSLNYRLGPLGFLSTQDNEISGNMGLKDQLLAIKWVKDNIQHFKGDPEQIILTGFSAGGASVHYHVLSPKSQGLFKVAISHSGSAFCAWASVHNPLERAKKLAAHLNCPTDNTKEMKECLKQKNASDIVSAVQIFQPFMYIPFAVFGPTIENSQNPHAFIAQDLRQIIIKKESAKTPWLLSFTTDEGGYNAANFLKKDSNGNAPIDSLGEKWSQLAPLILLFNETVPVDNHASYAQQIQEKYLGSEEFSSKHYKKVQKMFTDFLFLHGFNESIALHTIFNNTPLFVYRYNRPLAYGEGQLLSQRDDIEFGTVHGDDFYLLFMAPFIPASTYTEDDNHVSTRLINLYESFIKTGVPKFGDLEIPLNDDANMFKILQINGLDDYKVVETPTIIETN